MLVVSDTSPGKVGECFERVRAQGSTRPDATESLILFGGCAHYWTALQLTANVVSIGVLVGGSEACHCRPRLSTISFNRQTSKTVISIPRHQQQWAWHELAVQDKLVLDRQSPGFDAGKCLWKIYRKVLYRGTFQLIHRRMETKIEVENEIQGRWHASIRRGVVSRRNANAGLDINSLRSTHSSKQLDIILFAEGYLSSQFVVRTSANISPRFIQYLC